MRSACSLASSVWCSARCFSLCSWTCLSSSCRSPDQHKDEKEIHKSFTSSGSWYQSSCLGSHLISGTMNFTSLGTSLHSCHVTGSQASVPAQTWGGTWRTLWSSGSGDLSDFVIHNQGLSYIKCQRLVDSNMKYFFKAISNSLTVSAYNSGS